MDIGRPSCCCYEPWFSAVFGRPLVKRFALCYRTCPNIRVLRPNGWTDQGETLHAGKPRPWPHCVGWGPRSPSPKGHSPQFWAHICCGQIGRSIKMALGRKVGLDPSDNVFDGDPAPPPQKGGRAPPNFRPMSIVQIAGWIKMPLGMEVGLGPCHIVLDGDPAPSQKGGTTPHFLPMFVVAKRLDGSRFDLLRW